MKKSNRGFSLFGHGMVGEIKEAKRSILMKRFTIVPFSVLHADRWRARKRAWLRLGIKGGEGRLEDNGKKKKTCYVIGNKEKWEKTKTNDPQSGISTFDPVLCELMCRWFCPPGGKILDPFCGGATSGIVSTVLGYRFVGIDTRPEQIAANIPQAKRLGVDPVWLCGNSENLHRVLPPDAKIFDLIWTDPPYFDLEIYGGGDGDGSTRKTFADFMQWLGKILKKCVEVLRDNRFFCIKIGEVRGRDGAYVNLVGETISMMRGFGLAYYNELILVTAAGSLPIRTTKQFQGSRKIGRTHQTILVFYKGDVRKVKDHFSEISMED